MNDNPNDSGLLLPDLYIENFRGIRKLSIPRLGRVTLLAGRNGVGKTTVLDAIKVYAARGRQQTLARVLDVRDEITTPTDPREDGTVQINWAALFHGRSICEEAHVSIGPREKTGQLRIRPTIADYEHPAFSHMPDTLLHRLSGDGLPVFEVDCQGRGYFLIPLGYGGSLSSVEELLPEINCELVGPGALARSDAARMWNKVALTDDEERIARSIGLTYGDEVGRVGVIGDDVRGNGGTGCGPSSDSRAISVPYRCEVSAKARYACSTSPLPSPTAATVFSLSTKRRMGFTTPYSETTGAWYCRPPTKTMYRSSPRRTAGIASGASPGRL